MDVDSNSSLCKIGEVMEPSIFIGDIGISLIMALVALGSAIGTAVAITAKISKIEHGIGNLTEKVADLDKRVDYHANMNNQHSVQFAQIIERMSNIALHVQELRNITCNKPGAGCPDE